MNLERNERIVTNYSRHKDVLKIVVTDSTTEIARTFLYRVLTDNVFGKNQSLLVSLYEQPGRAAFLESVAIELTSFGPNVLNEISYGQDISLQFKDADVVICIGFAREYCFKREEFAESFFTEYIRLSKFYGEAIDKYVKKDAKIIVLGNTAATIISRYAKSISPKNISTLSLINLNVVTAQIANRMRCLPTEVRNIIIWGSNGMYSFPDCRYVFFTNGNTLTDGIKVWIRNGLPRIIRKFSSRPCNIRSIAYCLAEHCKILWNGTPENEWTSMGVLSDHSYGVRSGIFFSYPVFSKDKQYEIVENLDNDEYIKKYISDLSKLVAREAKAGLKICGLKP
ncbi:Malate dehydrogenase, cytoplasmic [Habropoda laboriosa]|uniref:Malate dehydrogenase, cytoplasmic n=1 Tax=Habropoda laboriosa TaxID=597456 RepID=A0A0L7RC98_9HYME|nr:PREDICTED: malate dehydrogenase, cytoplasmic-like [Habropoda laboriosa]KOC68420.1 Malate dehydrogenase, cytoplasmic [Habropoda laboriosa]